MATLAIKIDRGASSTIPELLQKNRGSSWFNHRRYSIFTLSGILYQVNRNSNGRTKISLPEQ